MDMDYPVPGIPILLVSSGIDSSEVESCVWYVGDEEVSHTETMVSYTPSVEDEEHFIRVAVTLRDGRCYEDEVFCSVLPVVYLESDTAYQNVGKEEDASVFMKLAAKREYHPSQLYSGLAQIHLRGNSTSTLPKLPFKLKLDEKANLLNLGETKHWVLLANAIDSTLLRNKLAYDFSGDIGAPCQMNSELVSLIYNGEYQGIYQLCEQVRIGENSVNIYNWEDAAKEAAGRISASFVEDGCVPKEDGLVFREEIELDLCSDFSWITDRAFELPSLEVLNRRDGSELPTMNELEDYFDFDDLPSGSGGVLLGMDFLHMEDADLKTNYQLPFYYENPGGGQNLRRAPFLYSGTATGFGICFS